METTMQADSTVAGGQQYSIAKILGIWALAAGPMAILSWVIFPALSPDFSADPLGAGVTRFVLLTIGLAWLFVLSMLIVRQEEGDLRWSTVKRRLRLNAPRDPSTGEQRRRLWLWLVPITVASVAWDVALTPAVNGAWVTVFPFLAEPAGYDAAVIFETPQILQRLAGAWWFLALFVVMSIFNVALGEEFLFRGVLLPRMEGVFGRWTWLANGALFACFHLHQPWTIAGNVVGGALFLAWPARRFRSTWMAVAVHSVQNIFFGLLILGVVLGLT